MGFLTDPRNAQYVDPGQVGAAARGFVPPSQSYDVGGQMVQAPMGLSNPAPLERPHIADQAANIVGQYITDHGNLLRQRLLMGHFQDSGFAPPKYRIPDLVSQIRSIPRRTIDPQWSNQGALTARIQRGVQGNLPKLIQAFQAQRYEGRH